MTPSAPKTACAIGQRRDDGSARWAAPWPVRRPGCRRPGDTTGSSMPWRPTREPTDSPSWRASVALTSAVGSSPDDRGRCRRRGSGRGRAARAPDRCRRASPARAGARSERSRAEVRAAARTTAPRRRRPGVPRLRRASLIGQPALTERPRRAAPRRRRASSTARSTAASMPAFVARPAYRTATPRATPIVVRAVRSGSGAQAAPGESVETAHRRQRPRLASRAIRAVASWSARRPSSIVSRMRPSPMTWTRSA